MAQHFSSGGTRRRTSARERVHPATLALGDHSTYQQRLADGAATPAPFAQRADERCEIFESPADSKA